MVALPFEQRFGLDQPPPITQDFPTRARLALAYLLGDLISKGYAADAEIISAIARAERLSVEDVAAVENATRWPTETIEKLLLSAEWVNVYRACEYVYGWVLREVNDYEQEHYVSLEDVRHYYSEELNRLLLEENIRYHFVDGLFQLRGRAQTQKSSQRVSVVLGDPILADCRVHYNKALRFFHTFPTPESANTIKEAVCALEAAASSLTGRSSKEDLSKAITRLQGNAPGQIPAPIAQGMIKLYGYRGGAKGVAHAARDGNRASELEAELVLSLAASYITYLYDLLKESNDIPF